MGMAHMSGLLREGDAGGGGGGGGRPRRNLRKFEGLQDWMSFVRVVGAVQDLRFA